LWKHNTVKIKIRRRRCPQIMVLITLPGRKNNTCIQRVSSSRRTDGVRRRTTINEDFYNSIVTTETSKNKYANYDDDESNDSNTDTDSGDVQPTTIFVAENENHHVAAGARADDGISVSASSETISPFMKLITMASIPSLSDPSPPLNLTPASKYNRDKYYGSKEEQMTMTMTMMRNKNKNKNRLHQK
jgi:hypothetical protein